MRFFVLYLLMPLIMLFPPVIHGQAYGQTRTLNIVYTGGVTGELEPCGCSPKTEFGGVARRAGYIAEQQKMLSPYILIDAGNFLDKDTPQRRLKAEAMKEAIFRAHFVERKNIGDVKVLEEIGEKIRLGINFSKRLRSGDKAKDVQKALDMAGAYSVDETPTLIIAGNIMTNPHAFNHNIDAFRENVMTILRSILK